VGAMTAAKAREVILSVGQADGVDGRAMPGPRSYVFPFVRADTQSGQINFTARRNNVIGGVRLRCRPEGASASGGAGVERSRVPSAGASFSSLMLIMTDSFVERNPLVQIALASMKFREYGRRSA